MASLDRIRTEGFRRWYERQLIECHAWLVSWFLGLIVLVSGLEVAGAGGASRMSGVLLLIGAPVGGAVIGFAIDSLAGTAPKAMLVMLFLGLIAGFVQIWRISKERAE